MIEKCELYQQDNQRKQKPPTEKKEVTSLPVTVVSVNIDLTPVVVVMLVVNTITVHYLISFTQVISVKLV